MVICRVKEEKEKRGGRIRLKPGSSTIKVAVRSMVEQAAVAVA